MAVPDLWRTQKQRYALQGATCPHCTSAVFPPRAVCPYCRRPMSVRLQTQPTQGREFVYPLAALAAAQPVAAAGDD